MKSWAVWFVVPALALAACGGGDGDSSAGNADDWCSLAQGVEDVQDDLDAVDETDPGSLKEVLQKYKSTIDEAAKAAPDEILAEVNAAADGVDQFDSILAEVDYDFLALDEAGIEDIIEVGAAIEPAVEAIEDYNERVCGIPADDDDSTDDSAGADDDPPESTVAAADGSDPSDDESDDSEVSLGGDSESPWCIANRAMDDIGDQIELMFLSSPAELEVGLAELLTELRALSSVAPPEIADDVATSVSGLEALDSALSEADYDILETDLSVLEQLGDEMDEAGDRIAAYNEDVCGIIDDPDVESDDDAGGDFDPGAGSIRDQTVAVLMDQGFTAEEADCIFDGIDFTDPDVGEDGDAMIALFDECGIDLARITELFG